MNDLRHPHDPYDPHDPALQSPSQGAHDSSAPLLTPADALPDTALDQASFFNLSPLLNPRDPVSLSLLVQTAIAATKGARVLSDTELHDLRRELRILASRRTDLAHKLALERKIRDAASQLSKYHSPAPSKKHMRRRSSASNATSSAAPSVASPVPPGSTPPTPSSLDDDADDTVPTTTTSNRSSLSNFRSLLSSSHPAASDKKPSPKRLSKHALDEVAVATHKILGLEQELAAVAARAAEIERVLGAHATAVLALTHPGAGTDAHRVYAASLDLGESIQRQRRHLHGQGSAGAGADAGADVWAFQERAVDYTTHSTNPEDDDFADDLVSQIYTAAPALRDTAAPDANTSSKDLLRHLVSQLTLRQAEDPTPTPTTPSTPNGTSTRNNAQYWQRKYELAQRQLQDAARENNEIKIRLEMQALELRDHEAQKQYLQHKILDRLQDPMSVKILRHEFQRAVRKSRTQVI